jgi:hypothetical protein
MKCSDPSTWPEPSTEYACEDAGYGSVRVRAFSKLELRRIHLKRTSENAQNANFAKTFSEVQAGMVLFSGLSRRVGVD